MKFILYGQGGYYNRGCEAIIRSTTNMIRSAFKDAEVSTAAYEYKGDRALNYGVVDHIYPHSNVRYTLPHLLAFGFRKLGMNDLDIKYQYKWFEDLLGKGDVFISVGGDNYCYEPPLPFYHIDKMAKAAGKKMFFWGASFDKDLVDETMVEDLKLFDAIMVRESLSYEALKSKGIENVFLHPDPAFTMAVSHADLPSWWKKDKTIGLNLSALSMRYSSDSNIVFDAVCKMVEHIINDTDNNIALVPHVVDDAQKNTQNDLTALNEVLEKYKDTNRVFMIDHSEYNAKELKGYISRCRAFVGARTHSTIAAYSLVYQHLLLVTL